MPLDEPTRRLALLLQHELERMVDRERSRAARGERVQYDSIARMATWESARGDVVGRWYGEVLATWILRDRILRWTWASYAFGASAFGSVARATHAEVVSREGRSRGVPQFAMSVVGDLEEEEAITLVRLGVVAAGGQGLEVRRLGDEIELVGLFDSPRPPEEDAHGRHHSPAGGSRYSVPPPAVAARSSPPAGIRPRSNPPGTSGARVASYGSLPPIREIYGPPSRRRSTPPPEPRIREPARALFLPVANLVLRHIAKAAAGYRQALFVLTVDAGAPAASGAAGIGVQLVALDAAGMLRALEAPNDLVESAARMVEADRNDGNGRWRKLSARITPKPDGGATLNVDVI